MPFDNEPATTRWPILGAFGDGPHEFLNDEAAATAATADRIRSVWPYLVSKVSAFQRRLKPHEKIAFDIEDTLAELFVKLAERDHKWTPERGKYLNFAAAIADRELAGIRDRASTVESPRNVFCRMKEYAKREAAGTLSERCKKTAADIARTRQGAAEIATGSVAETARVDDPVSVLLKHEERAELTEELSRALASLESDESDVLVRMAGLGGREPESAREVALTTGQTDVEVKATYLRARGALRRSLIGSRSSLVPGKYLKTG